MPLIIGDEQNEILQQLKEQGVIVPGHFTLRSGRHSDTYLDKRKFFSETPKLFDYFCQKIAEHIIASGYQGIVAPAEAGMIVAEKVISIIKQRGLTIEYVPARKVEDKFVIDPKDVKRVQNKCIAVVDDVMTTGQTAFDVGNMAYSLRMVFNCVYCLFDRGATERKLSRKVYPVMQLTLPSWEAPCHLCRDNVPLSPKPSG